MKHKFKFKAVTYHGKVIFFTKEIECPDFEVIPSKKWNSLNLPETSIESQVMDWYDNQDKKDLMIKKDLGIIIDYWIPENKKPKPSLIDVLKQFDLSEQMTLDLIAVYKEIKPLLKGKSVNKQIEILFSHLNIGYMSSANAYERITDILKSGSVANELLKEIGELNNI